jgi:hypothetical protein
MTIEERIRVSAHRIADEVDPPALDIDLVRRRAHADLRRRTGIVAAVVATVVTCVLVPRVFGSPSTAPQPVDQPPGRVKLDPGSPENGTVVSAIGGGAGGWRPSAVDALPKAGAAPYPAWKAFDQDSGRFLYTSDGITGYARTDDLFTVRVVAAGQDAPLATIRCRPQCNWIPAFGPEPDEVTVVIEQEGEGLHTAYVYGFDGQKRDEIDLASVLENSGIADLEWSPDGSRLAVSTFTGAREPDCPAACLARVWILDRAGDDPELVYQQSMPQQGAPNPPMLTDLAWAPDGERLGLISSTYYPERAADPPTLLAVTVASGQVDTLHEFGDCGACDPAEYGFAWSPHGVRIAVTSGNGIAQLSSDGTVLVPATGRDRGPLAWLVQPPD